MSDLLSAAYDTFGGCHRCGSYNVTPETEAFHVRGECVMGQRDRALAAAKELRAALKDAADAECLNGCAELPDSVDGFREHTEVCGRWNTTLAATAWLEDR